VEGKGFSEEKRGDLCEQAEKSHGALSDPEKSLCWLGRETWLLGPEEEMGEGRK